MSIQGSEKFPTPTSNLEFACSRHSFDNLRAGPFCLYRGERNRRQRQRLQNWSTLSGRKPGVFVPEELQRDAVAAENIPLGVANVGDPSWIHAARKIALAIARVLPEVPIIPWRRVARLEMVIRDPEPAVRECSPLRRGHSRTVKHLPETIFAT